MYIHCACIICTCMADVLQCQGMEQGDSGISEGGSGRVEMVTSGRVRSEDGGDPVVDFPLDHLARLDEQLGRPKWVVPVRHGDDLELLLQASIRLCRESE